MFCGKADATELEKNYIGFFSKNVHIFPDFLISEREITLYTLDRSALSSSFILPVCLEEGALFGCPSISDKNKNNKEDKTCVAPRRLTAIF